MTSTAIQRKVVPPDGLFVVYCPMVVGLGYFSPSMLSSLDDTFLNASFLYLCLESYLSQELSDLEHYLMSPKLTPNYILRKFPPTRMLIAGLDPLRDEQLRFILRLAKLNIDIKATEYRYLMHTCTVHHKSPFFLNEAVKMLDNIISYICELSIYT